LDKLHRSSEKKTKCQDAQCPERYCSEVETGNKPYYYNPGNEYSSMNQVIEADVKDVVTVERE